MNSSGSLGARRCKSRHHGELSGLLVVVGFGFGRGGEFPIGFSRCQWLNRSTHQGDQFDGLAALPRAPVDPSQPCAVR